MDETLAIYYTIEMLKIVETLHATHIIHGDIKPDNFLIKNNTVDVWLDWGSGAEGGWDAKGLKLIDYGRSIDTTLFPTGTRYRGDYHVSGFK
jgi:checkpoint serine/threonine-protein kinase